MPEEHIKILQEYFDKICFAINPDVNCNTTSHPSETRFTDINPDNYTNDLSEFL